MTIVHIHCLQKDICMCLCRWEISGQKHRKLWMMLPLESRGRASEMGRKLTWHSITFWSDQICSLRKHEIFIWKRNPLLQQQSNPSQAIVKIKSDTSVQLNKLFQYWICSSHRLRSVKTASRTVNHHENWEQTISDSTANEPNSRKNQLPFISWNPPEHQDSLQTRSHCSFIKC